MNRHRLHVRTAFASIIALLVLLGLGSAPAQAVKIQNPSPPDFSGELTGGLIQLAGQDDKLLQLPLDFPVDPSTGKPANPTFRGTIDAAGNIHIPKAQLVFPALKYEIKDSLIDIYLKATDDATGFIDPLSGRVDLDIPMQIQALGNVTVTDPITITVNLGNKCVIGTPEHPIMVRGTTHMGERPAADQVYVADFLANKKFDGGLMPAGPYSDEPGLWPDGPKPDGVDYELVPRGAGSFRLADENLAAPKVGKYDGSDCGAAVNPVLNKELGLPSIEGQSTAILDFQFKPSTSRPGAAALVQKGVKSNFTIPGFTSEDWPSTEVPEIPTHVPFEIRAGQSHFAAGVGSHPDGGFSFDLGDGYGAFTDQANQELSFDTPGERTIRVRARDADGDIDTKAREVLIVPSTDIALDLDAENDSFRAGSSGRLLADVTNLDQNRSNTQPIELSIDLPDGVTYQAFDAPAGWDCGNAGQQVTCGLPAGQLGPEATDQVAIQVNVDAESASELNVSATVRQAGDPVPDNDAQAITVPVRKTDLAVTLSHQGEVVANGTIPFDVTVSNLGDADTAGEVNVHVDLPEGIDLLAAQSGGEGWTCSPAGEGITCLLTDDRIAAGADGPPLRVLARADRTTSGPLAAQATVTTNGDTDAFGGEDHSEDSFEVLVRPDLALETSIDGDYVVGDDGAVTFEVTNQSVLPITGPTMIEADLPDGLTVDELSGSGWDCAATEAGSARIECDFESDLEPLESAPELTAELAVGHAAYPTVQVGAELKNEFDGFAGNDAGQAVAGVRRIDLAMSKSALRDFSVGIEGQYRLSVSNVGDAATVGDIRVVDELPPELSLASVSGGGWDCSDSIPGGQLVECVTDAVVAPGTAAPVITLKVDVASEAADLGEVTNVATVDTERDDRNVEGDEPVSGNNAGTAVTKAVSVDLSVQSSHGAPFRVGTDRAYSLKVRNVGFFATDPGQPVTVVDQLPVGMIPDADGIQVDRDGWSCAVADGDEGAGERVTCVLAAPDEQTSAMGKGQTATIDIPVHVTDSATDPSVNVAEISTARDDSSERSPNNRSEDTTEVTRIDLGTAAETTISPRAGGIGELSVNLANHGSAPTIGPSLVKISLPSGVTLRPEGSTLAGWRCGSAEPDTGLVCEFPSVISAGEQASPLGIRLNIAPDVPDEWQVDVSARTEGEVESRLADNDVSLAQELEKVDLRMLRSHLPGSIKAGHQGEYTLAVENVGNTGSAGVTAIEETVPAAFEDPKASGPGWECRIDDHDLRCTRTASIPAGETAPPVTVNFRVPADPSGEPGPSQTVHLSATVLNHGDPYPANDTAEDTITVIAAPDLAISAAIPETMRVGEHTDLTYRVRNVGTESASGDPGISLVVFLPENVEPVDTLSSDSWNCETGETDGFRSITCRLDGELAPGAESTLTAVVRLSGSSGPVTLAASVSAEGDPNSSNDSVSNEANPTGVDLATRVDAPVEEMEAGAPNRRTVSVSNHGLEASTGTIRVLVPLPEGVAWSDEVPPGSGWDCVQPARTVLCSSDDGLAPGDALPGLNLDLVPSRSNAPSVAIEYRAETVAEQDDSDNTVTREETVVFSPETVVESAPDGNTTSRSARIEFSSDDPDADFECRIKSAYEPCVSPLTLDGLEPGAHSVLIRAVNQRGMVDASPARVSWVVVANVPSGESGSVRLTLREGSLNLASLGKVDLEPGQLVLAGELYENGALVVPASGFEFAPVKQKVDAPGLGTLDVGIAIGPIGPGSGSLSPDGEASLSLPVEAKLDASLEGSVLIGPEADCYLRPVQFELSGSHDPAAGTMGVGSDALSPPAVSAGCGALGSIVDSMLGLPRDDIGADFDFDVERSEPSCADGEIGVPPDCRAARIDLAAAKVSLSKRKVESGGKVKVKVRLKNRGDLAAGNAKICLDAPKKLIRGKARRCQKVSIAAGRAATVTIKVRLKPTKTRRRAQLKVTVPTGDGSRHRTVKRTLTIKPKR